ncbi:MAG: hypothetical protein GXO90_11515 [FCB group bacterium]|nr:hypothetical protein [FCB group bacterium]
MIRRLTGEDGLSQNFVTSMLQDRDGFLWFGTADGLNRYDGTQFTIFHSDPEDTTRIADSYIQVMINGLGGTLWIGTDQGGLDRYEPDAGQFRHFGLPPKPVGEATVAVTALAQDPRGTVWVGTTAGLWRLDPYQEHWTATEIVGPVHSLRLNRQGVLWIGTERALIRRDPLTGEYQSYSTGNPDRIPNPVRCIFEDHAGRIWIGAREGFYQVDFLSGRLRAVSLGSGKVEPEVAAIAETEDRYLWLGTSRVGLFRYEPDTKTRRQYLPDRSSRPDPSLEGILQLLVDQDGLLWIATRGLGVQVLNPDPPFQYYHVIPGDNRSLSSTSIRAIYLAQDSVLWVGGYQGLDRFDRRTGAVRHYRYNPQDPQGLPMPYVYALAEDESGNLWVGTEGKGLARLDRETDTFQYYPHEEGNDRSLGGDFVFALLMDHRGDLWIGTENGLSRLKKTDRETGRFETRTPENSGLPGSVVTCLAEDSFGNLWVGTESSGLGVLDKETDRFRVLRHDRRNPRSLSQNRILCLTPTTDGGLWIGTKGGGLNRLDYGDFDPQHPDRTPLTWYTTRDGLSNDVVYGVLEDVSGALWLSTNDGIVRMDPQTERFQTFPQIDGIQDREFNRGAWHKGWNGELFFGGIKGLNSFFPQRIRKRTVPPPVIITDIQILNQSLLPGRPSSEGVGIDRSVSHLSKLELNHKVLAFHIEFAALSYLDPGANRYAYRLRPLLKEWVALSTSQRDISLTHLPPGEFTLELKAANAAGVWSVTPTSLTLLVKPAPWNTWWAWALYFIAGGLLLFLFVRDRVNRVRTYTQRLEQEVRERTAEIRANEEQLLEQKSFLETVIESLAYPFYVVDVRTYKLVMANTAAREWGKSDANTCFALKYGQEKPCGGSRCPLRNVEAFRKHRVSRDTVMDAEGKKRHIEIHAHPIIGPDGNIEQIIEYYLDITDRVQLELSLKRSLEERNRELTAQAMKMARNHETTMQVIKSLEKLHGNLSSGIASTLIRSIESSLKSQVSPGNEWNEFETWFKEVHKDFYHRLMDRVPDLTTREMKICAFLKLKLNTKEIASLTNLSVKSVEVYRSRLRSRLGVPRGENLVTYINQL